MTAETPMLEECDSIREAALQVKPDLIILDLKMKSVNGFEGASALRHFPQTSGIPIIAMSAYYTVREHEFLTNFCGIKRFLKKPFGSGEAVGQIEEMLREKKDTAYR